MAWYLMRCLPSLRSLDTWEAACGILDEEQLKITHFVDNIITINMMELSKMLLIFIS